MANWHRHLHMYVSHSGGEIGLTIHNHLCTVRTTTYLHATLMEEIVFLSMKTKPAHDMNLWHRAWIKVEVLGRTIVEGQKENRLEPEVGREGRGEEQLIRLLCRYYFIRLL